MTVADEMTTAARTGRPRRFVNGGHERRITAISSDQMPQEAGPSAKEHPFTTLPHLLPSFNGKRPAARMGRRPTPSNQSTTSHIAPSIAGAGSRSTQTLKALLFLAVLAKG